MDGQTLTHLSAHDISIYLLGNPAASRTSVIQAHCRNCHSCLEQMGAIAARINRLQLSRYTAPTPIHAGALETEPWRLVMAWIPQWTPRWNSYAVRMAAAGFILMLAPDTSRFVHLEHLFDSSSSMASIDLPSTRAYPPILELTGMSKPDFAVALDPKPEKHIQPSKLFVAPVLKVQHAPGTELALLEPPDVNVPHWTFEPPPVAFEASAPPMFRPKPNVIKRLFSAVASPFRTPRS